MISLEKSIKGSRPLTISVSNIVEQPLHRHQGIFEILFILKGDFEMKLSFEQFTINEGDFVVIHTDDYHSLKAHGENCIAASLCFDLDYLEKYFKNIRYITFITDKQKKYPRQVDLIRLFFAEAAILLLNRREDQLEEAIGISKKIISILEEHFTEISYFNDNIKINSIKRDRYYLIMRYIHEYYPEKTLLDNISSNEFFCKSYLSHLFKDVGKFSFLDIVSYIRNWKSEELLLTTKLSINQISEQCGYSDPKYYYKHFKKWYKCTPSEYRKMFRDELGKKEIERPVDPELQIEMFSRYLTIQERDEEAENSSGPNNKKAAVKITGRRDLIGKKGRNDLARQYAFAYLFEERMLPALNSTMGEIIYNWNYIREVIESLDEINASPCIAVNYNSRSRNEWENIFKECNRQFGYEKIKTWEFLIMYEEYESMDEIVGFINEIDPSNGIRMKPLLLI